MFISVNVLSSPSLRNYSWHWDEFMDRKESLFSQTPERMSQAILFLSCHKCIDSPDLPRACVNTVWEGLSPNPHLCLWSVLELHRNVEITRCIPKYSISPSLWSSILCPTAVFYHRCIKSLDLLYQLCWGSSWIFLKHSQGHASFSTGFYMKELGGRQLLQTRVRPIHVICEEWGLCCFPLQLACCVCCCLQSLTTCHQDPGASTCAEHLSSSVLVFIEMELLHWGCHWAQSWSLKRSQRGIMRKSVANPSLISVSKNIDIHVLCS